MANLGTLLDEFRAAINTEARNSGRASLFLTAAVSNTPRVNGLNYPVQSVARNLGWLNVMSYDFYGPNWSPSQTNSHAQLFDPVNHVSDSDGTASWIQAGVAAQKLVLGIPFYGYAWQLVNANNHGLRAPANGKSSAGSIDDGSMTYIQIRNYIVQNRATTVYDNTQTVRNKVTYVKGRGLRGYFAWHVAADQNWLLSKTATIVMKYSNNMASGENRVYANLVPTL
ncbi:hypothetical protein KY285_029604 [Solanum tuberosum]|nr:hypothetical protein KY285_029604 [Solanum tuberosum]